MCIAIAAIRLAIYLVPSAQLCFAEVGELEAALQRMGFCPSVLSALGTMRHYGFATSDRTAKHSPDLALKARLS